MINDLPTVLIVDDEPGLLRSLMAFFEDENFSVAGAKSGEEALQLLNKEQFDAVILDMRLPGIDGNEVVLQAKQGVHSQIFHTHWFNRLHPSLSTHRTWNSTGTGLPQACIQSRGTHAHGSTGY